LKLSRNLEEEEEEEEGMVCTKKNFKFNFIEYLIIEISSRRQQMSINTSLDLIHRIWVQIDVLCKLTCRCLGLVNK